MLIVFKDNGDASAGDQAVEKSCVGRVEMIEVRVKTVESIKNPRRRGISGREEEESLVSSARE